ncbi:hypothetical protein [Cellulomonas sp. HZM]|uniref:hypothetical protein n=1 Tax=Cellulomonas sp. HZM TaxID=1454010 RepID=UPI00049347F9|nr:hypothetical protein [Cellulomonas sp. HZM]
MTTTTDDATALSDRAVSILRTAVPALWGSLVAAVLAALAPHLPATVYDALADALSSDVTRALVVAVVIAAWYALWRRLEPHTPDWLTRLVLGSARTPGYPLPEISAEFYADGAHVITTLTDDEVSMVRGLRKIEGRDETTGAPPA